MSGKNWAPHVPGEYSAQTEHGSDRQTYFRILGKVIHNAHGGRKAQRGAEPPPARRSIITKEENR